MRRLVLKMSVSVDGFVAGPDGEVDWVFKSADDNAMVWLLETLWQADVHIMGSRTYAAMAAYWPSSTAPLAAPMNEIPKVAFSKRGMTIAALSETPPAARPGSSTAVTQRIDTWQNSAVAGGELVDEINKLKKLPGTMILAHGGARFAQNLARLRLVDEYRLLVHPVALGRGLSLFDALPEPIELHLASAQQFASGIVAHVYEATN